MNELAGIRFPRTMIQHKASERLFASLGVTFVDEADAELEDYTRAWLLMVEATGWGRDAPATHAVRRALADRQAKAVA